MDATTTHLRGILLAYTAFLLTILTPKPNNLAVVGAALSGGRRAGMALALGVSTGSLVWALATAFKLITGRP